MGPRAILEALARENFLLPAGNRTVVPQSCTSALLQLFVVNGRNKFLLYNYKIKIRY
jgi:hypothetical protein